MSKLKVMAIAPYEGLKEAIISAAEAYKDRMEITAVEANLNQSLVWAVEAEKQGYDAIISRGGTAELLLEHTKLPVISIDVSGYDYIRTLKLADNLEGEKAFVGFQSITKRAESVNAMLQSNIRIFTIQSYSELEPLLSELNRNGYSIIIGDVAACRVARDMAMNAMLLSSGSESIIDALEQTLLVQHFLNPWKEQVSALLQTIDQSMTAVVIVSDKANILYKNHAFDLLHITQTELAGYLGNTNDFRKQELVVQREKGFLRISSRELSLEGGKVCYALYINKHLYQMPEQMQGIKVYNFKHRGASADTLLRQSGIYDHHCISMAGSFSKVDAPFLITGDTGVGKVGMAMAIHRLSRRWNLPFIKVNCHRADPIQAVKSLCLGSNDGMDLSGGTVCFEALEAIPRNSQPVLLELLISLEESGWRFAATSVDDLERLSSTDKMDVELYRYFSELSLYIPGIKETGRNLKNIVNLYIIESNTRYGKQIAGITPDAMEFIAHHHWQQNFSSLRQAITQMVISAKGDYITLENALNVVRAREPEQSRSMIDLRGTLDEITRQVIQKVLDEENGNQSKTAARLGISRSTLWRKLGCNHSEDEDQ